ncbi:hypothetical protein FGRMN_4028 [Fusarium graminum]|nr:hypothetical protein FGRMN_4028 [Fusarium graminum]
MPQGTFSTRVQTAWDRVTRRRERQQPGQSTDAEADQHRSQTRASRITHGGSLPELLGHAILDERPEWLPAGTKHPSNYSLALSPSLDSGSILTAFMDEVEQNPVRQESLNVPIVAVATSHTGSTTDDEAPDPAWKLPGRVSPQEPSIRNSVTMAAWRLHGDVFALLLDFCVSPNGFIGHESRLNLPIMLVALSYAFDQGMTYEVEKLKDTIHRYVALRMFHHNPHIDSSLSIEYFKYRSEEIYRSWISLSRDERLQKSLTLGDLVKLYVYMIPYKWWPQLVGEYHWEFMEDIQHAHDEILGKPEESFEGVFNDYFHRTRLGIHPWIENTARSLTFETATGDPLTRPAPLRLDTPIIQPPIPMSDTSDSPERVIRHIRRETAIFPSADAPIDI